MNMLIVKKSKIVFDTNINKINNNVMNLVRNVVVKEENIIKDRNFEVTKVNMSDEGYNNDMNEKIEEVDGRVDVLRTELG